jgi:hypothetical protein
VGTPLHAPQRPFLRGPSNGEAGNEQSFAALLVNGDVAPILALGLPSRNAIRRTAIVRLEYALIGGIDEDFHDGRYGAVLAHYRWGTGC